MVSSRLYRVLMKGSQSLRKMPRSKARSLASHIIQCNLLHLSKFSMGKMAVLAYLEEQPGYETLQDMVRNMFRGGEKDDLDLLIKALPNILRYSAACNHIQTYFAKVEASPERLPDQYMHGALLVSQLFHPSNKLKQIEGFVASSTKEIVQQCRAELETKYGKGPHRIIDKIKAYNSVLTAREKQRFHNTSEETSSHEIVHLVDQMLDTKTGYSYALPIAHSVLFCAIMDKLGVQAVGIPFPRVFMSRVISKEDEVIPSSTSTTSTTTPHDIMASHVSVTALEGNFVSHFPAGMQEVSIIYDAPSGILTATKLDGDDFVPANHVTWRLDLSGYALQQWKNMQKGTEDGDEKYKREVPEGVLPQVPLGVPLAGELQVAKEGFTSPQFLPCNIEVLRIIQDEEPWNVGNLGPSQPHLEMKLSLDMNQSEMPLLHKADEKMTAVTERATVATSTTSTDSISQRTQEASQSGGKKPPMKDAEIAIALTSATEGEEYDLQGEQDIITLHVTVEEENDGDGFNSIDNALTNEMDEQRHSHESLFYTSSSSLFNQRDPEKEYKHDETHHMTAAAKGSVNALKATASTPMTSAAFVTTLGSKDKDHKLNPLHAYASAVTINFVPSDQMHRCLMAIDSGITNLGPVTPEQYLSLLARHADWMQSGVKKQTIVNGVTNEHKNLEVNATELVSESLQHASSHAVVHRMIRNISLYLDEPVTLQTGTIEQMKEAALSMQEAVFATADTAVTTGDSSTQMSLLDEPSPLTTTSYWQTLGAFFEEVVRQEAKKRGEYRLGQDINP